MPRLPSLRRYRYRSFFSDSDKTYLNNILSYKNHYDYVSRTSSKYKIYLNRNNIVDDVSSVVILNKDTKIKNTHTFIPFGYLSNNKFIWKNGANSFFLDHLNRTNVSRNIGSRTLLTKLFKKKVKFNNWTYKYVIPYLISITNPKFNVIQFNNQSSGIIFFALINLNID